MVSTGGAGPDEAGGSRRPAGALEAEVLAVLWGAREPLTPGEVHGRLSEALAYKTVQTVLSRLYAKGLLERVQHGRAHAYSARRDPAELAAERMNAALGAGPGREAVLQHFVGGLDPAELAVLRELLGPEQ